MSCNYNCLGFYPVLIGKKKAVKSAVFRKKVASLSIAFMLLNLLFILSFSPLMPVSASEIENRMEPVIVYGIDVPDFIGTSVDEIWVYAYVGGNWRQIPFQIDERNDINGSFFFDSEDDVLDSNDEIVFMPFDCGDEAPPTSRAQNTEPQRYRIRVMDPIDSSMKYAYIYTSAVLSKTFTEDYVNYHMASHTIVAADYTMGFNEIYIGVIDEMRINTSAGGDNNDILDRFKYRFQKTIGLHTEQYDEENFTYELVGLKDGPVRVLRRMNRHQSTDGFNISVNDTIFAYKSYLYTTQSMTTNTSTDWVEITLDFLDPPTDLTYYDANLNELVIDGTPESPSGADAPTWSEVTGSFGTIVSVGNFSELGVTPNPIYTDDSGVPDDPESESGLYGKHGLSITNPPESSSVNYTYYFLGNNQENIGISYLNYTEKPLETSTLSQYIDPSPAPEITGVTKNPDPQEVNGYVNISANIQDNLNEVSVVRVNITDPNDNEVGNYSMSYDSNTGRYFYERTYDIKGTYKFIIWASDNNGNWEYSTGQFIMRDTTLPMITQIASLPDPQGVDGHVNISLNATDIVEVYGAWVNITNPIGFLLGNFSLSFDLSNNRYYLNNSYDIVGTYLFTIWVNDTSDNWNHSSGQFDIQDTVPPEANAGLDQDVTVGTIVAFDGSGSTDNIDVVSFTWTFFDASQKTLNEVSPTYRFNNIGDFEVLLNVTDARGNWDTDTMWVNVTEVILNGSISGTVMDEDGNPIVGARVTIEGTSFETTTDETGYYIIQNIPAGIYDITISQDGFKTKSIELVVVVAGETTSNDEITMSKVSATTEEGMGGYWWIILIIVIIVVLILVFLFVKPRMEKQPEEQPGLMEEEKVIAEEEQPELMAQEGEIAEEVVEPVHFECPECGAVVKSDMKMCPVCGVGFVESEEVEEGGPADIYMCPSCGSFVSSSATRCDKCGYDFEEEEVEEKEEVEEEEEEPNAPFAEEEQEIEEPEEKKVTPVVTEEMVSGVEAILAENGVEVEDIKEEEGEEEGEPGGEKVEAKEILELFKEELKTDESKEDLKKDYDTLSKEIDEILGNSEGEEPKEGDEESRKKRKDKSENM